MIGKIKSVYIFTLILSLVFCFNVCDVKAATLIDDELPELPTSENYPWALVYKSSSGNYKCVVHYDTMIDVKYLYWSSAGIYCPTLEFEGGALRYKLYNGEWLLEYDFSRESVYSIHFSNSGYESLTDFFEDRTNIFIYSDVNLYGENMSEVFFWQTPRNTSISLGLSAQSMTNLLMMEMVSLIPLVISLVISAMALRKGWTFLATSLARA